MDEPPKAFESRMRQLAALDRNARDIYTELAETCQDPDTSKTFRDMAHDETRHLQIEDEILSLLAKYRHEQR